MIFGSLILGFDKLSSKSQTTESLSNLKDFVRLSKCTVAMLKVGRRGGMILHEVALVENLKIAWKPIGLGPTK